MIYIAVVIIIVIAILVVYLYRLSSATYRRMKGRAPPRNVNDPEAQMTSRAAFPSMSGTARDVTNSLFRVSPEESNVYSAPHRSDRQTGVTREREADTAQADPDLPSYQESAAMPAPPPASYQSPEMVRHQHARQATEQRIDQPPKYETQPVVRDL